MIMRLRGTYRRLCIVKPKSNTYLNIDKWTSPFMIFVSIMLEIFPTRARESLKYLRDVRIAATRSNNWSKYDEQCSLRMSSQPRASWGHIYQDFWLYISYRQEMLPRQHTTQKLCVHSNQGNRTSIIAIRLIGE